ncbi:MAG: amidohydrolase family protein [Planctomycetes bacterium]|nr:amidohydrolase family protein [Planctomycetota bacterium]
MGRAAAATSPPQDAPVYVVRAAKVVTRPGHVLENAAVLVRNGRIERVAQDLAVPEGAQVIEGAVVCAGFIDPWSCLGVDASVLEDRSPDAATRTADGLDLFTADHVREECLAAGVTSARVQGGYRAGTCGLAAFVRVDPTLDTTEGAVIDEPCLAMSAGLSIDMGPSFRRMPDGSFQIDSGDRPIDVFDRVSAVERVVSQIETGRQYREAQVEYRYELEEWQKAIDEKAKELEKDFKKAKKDREKEIEKAKEKGKEFKDERYKEDKKPREPKYDAEREQLARVAEGELPLVVEVHRAAELRNLLKGTASFQRLRLVIAGGTEALTCADELAERQIPVIVWPSLAGPNGSDEFDGRDLALAGNLAAKGVPVLLGSGGRQGTDTRDLPLLAALAVGHGLDAQKAFEALTLGAARTFDQAHRVGSVEVGKDADLLVLDAMPFEPGSAVRYVLTGGRLAITPEN